MKREFAKILACVFSSLLIAVFFFACGSTEVVIKPVEKEDPNKGYFLPKTPLQERYYGDIPETDAGGVEKTIADEVSNIFIKKNMNPPKLDARLSLIGRELARYYIERKSIPPVSFQRQAGLWFGIGEYDIIAYYHSFIGSIDMSKYNEAVGETIGAMDKRLAPNFIGVGVMESQKSADTIVALVTLRRLVEFQPFPKYLNPGDSVAIKGTLLNPTWNAIATFTLPGKSPQAARVEIKPDGGFEIQVVTPKDISRFSFEFSAETEGARKPLAGFDIYLTEKEPYRFKYPKSFKDGELTPDAAEQLFVEWLNRDRKMRGLTELLENKTVSSLAFNWSGRGTVEAGDAEKQLLSRNIPFFYFRILNFKGSNIEEMYQNMLKSPSARMALFDHNFTHIGAGVYIVGAGDQRKIILNAVLLSAPISLDSKVLRDAYLRRINEFRISNGLVPFKYDIRLNKSLDEATEGLVSGDIDSAEIREGVKLAIQKLSPKVHFPATTYFTILTLDSKFPKQVASSLLKPERNSISFAIKPIVNPQSQFKGYLIYYVVFAR
ncbi:MAG: hypothetical protein Kow0090_17800 [Myxococcota bacterium]